MKRIAIIVGHYGRGTGASWQGRDEWTLARGDAVALADRLRHDGRVEPHMLAIDRDRDDAAVKWNSKTSFEVKLRWLADLKADAAIELHYNSAPTESAAGNEVLYREHGDLPIDIEHALRVLPNPRRGIKYRPDLYLLKRATCPAVLVEPAFIFEPALDNLSWRATLTDALAAGIYQYFFAED